MIAVGVVLLLFFSGSLTGILPFAVWYKLDGMNVGPNVFENKPYEAVLFQSVLNLQAGETVCSAYGYSVQNVYVDGETKAFDYVTPSGAGYTYYGTCPDGHRIVLICPGDHFEGYQTVMKKDLSMQPGTHQVTVNFRETWPTVTVCNINELNLATWPSFMCEEPLVSRTQQTEIVVPSTHSCGDGTCNTDETFESCPDDCPVPFICGDGICNNGETHDTCPSDCVAPDDNNTGGDTPGGGSTLPQSDTIKVFGMLFGLLLVAYGGYSL